MCAISATAQLVCVSPTSGQFMLFDDFEDESLGLIDGQDGWHSAGGPNSVVVDPFDPSNRVLEVPSSSSTLRKSLLVVGLPVPDGEARMLFLRLGVAEKQTFSMGVSHLTSPREYSDFGPEIGMANSTQNLDLRVWDDDGGNYVNVTQFTPTTWYNIWVHVDAASDTYRLWTNHIPGADASPDDLLHTETGDDLFAFRAGRVGDLVSFYIKTSGGSSGTNFGPIYIDDIYVEQSGVTNLANPVSGVCEADLNGDGMLDLTDIGIFVTAFVMQDPVADLTGDGVHDLADVNAFVTSFVAGCV